MTGVLATISNSQKLFTIIFCYLLSSIKMLENSRKTLQRIFWIILQGIQAFRFMHHLQILLLILKEFKWINYLLFPLKSSKSLCFSDDFRRKRSKLICLNLFNARSETSRQSFTGYWLHHSYFHEDFPSQYFLRRHFKNACKTLNGGGSEVYLTNENIYFDIFQSFCKILQFSSFYGRVKKVKFHKRISSRENYIKLIAVNHKLRLFPFRPTVSKIHKLCYKDSLKI